VTTASLVRVRRSSARAGGPGARAPRERGGRRPRGGAVALLPSLLSLLSRRSLPLISDHVELLLLLMRHSDEDQSIGLTSGSTSFRLLGALSSAMFLLCAFGSLLEPPNKCCQTARAGCCFIYEDARNKGGKRKEDGEERGRDVKTGERARRRRTRRRWAAAASAGRQRRLASLAPSREGAAVRSRSLILFSLQSRDLRGRHKHAHTHTILERVLSCFRATALLKRRKDRKIKKVKPKESAAKNGRAREPQEEEKGRGRQQGER
jgi:hypothetical protein